jgi:TolB-like protein/DNA-binding winged helix-turn-helix (wHTH) protein/Tfp pilus assembly protein PilF
MRSEIFSRRAFKVGEWLVQPPLNEISNHEQTLRIEPKVMEVLVCLAGRAGEVVSKETLIHMIWSDRFVTDEVITTTIWELRRALGDEARKPRFIQTIPRNGYRLIAPVVMEETPPAEAEAPVTPPAPSIAPAISSAKIAPSVSWWQRRWKPALVAAGALLLPLLLWPAVKWRNQPPPQRSVANINSLAVLPFRNLSGQANQEYLAEAVTEALITDLARYTPLRIAPRTSVMQYKAASKSAPEIARELGVDAVIEGSVLPAGDRVRVSVQLIHAAADRHLWAETYERELSDVLAWQSEMSQLIARELRASLTLQTQAQQATAVPTPSAAREAYLQGRELMKRRTEESVALALEQFERATQIAPDYALAWTGLADAYMQMVNLDEMRPEEGFPKAKAAALRALQLNDALAEAHASLAMIKLSYDWDWTGAETAFRRALALNPTYAMASNWYSQYLWAAGRADEAMREVAKAQELAPQSIAVLLNAGSLYLLRQQSDRAEACFRRVTEIDPKYVSAWKGLGKAFQQQGQLSEAEAAFQKVQELTDAPSATRMKENFAAWSRKGDPRYLLHKLSFVWKRKYVRASYIARLYADLGDKERAFEWLEKAYAERDSALLFLKTDQSWDSLRADPRFTSISHRIGLAS